MYTGSTAVLRAFRYVDGLWKLVAVLEYVPRVIRSPVYDWVDRHRFNWYGRKDVCMAPGDDVSDRFLTGGDEEGAGSTT